MGELLLRLLIGGGLGLLFLRVTVKSLVMIETLMNLRRYIPSCLSLMLQPINKSKTLFTWLDSCITPINQVSHFFFLSFSFYLSFYLGFEVDLIFVEGFKWSLLLRRITSPREIQSLIFLASSISRHQQRLEWDGSQLFLFSFLLWLQSAFPHSFPAVLISN